MSKTVLDVLAKGNFKKDFIRKALLFKKKQQRQLFKLAQDKRKEFFPVQRAEVRSVIEISNVCVRNCNFCNINLYSRIPQRYILKYPEIIKIIEYIYYKKNRRVVLLQSGENASQKYVDFVCKCLNKIKRKFDDMEIILCLGNLRRSQYRQLRDSGADKDYTDATGQSDEISLIYGKIKVNDASGPIGTINTTVDIVGSDGSIITEDDSTTFVIILQESILNSTASSSTTDLTISGGSATLSITDTEAETVTVTVTPDSLPELDVEAGTVIFSESADETTGGGANRIGSGARIMFWRELRSDEAR